MRAGASGPAVAALLVCLFVKRCHELSPADKDGACAEEAASTVLQDVFNQCENDGSE